MPFSLGPGFFFLKLKTCLKYVLRSADRYAYIFGCGSTACYLFYLGSELILIDIRKPYRSSTCLVRYSWSLSS
jgi:hypothetical protein